MPPDLADLSGPAPAVGAVAAGGASGADAAGGADAASGAGGTGEGITPSEIGAELFALVARARAAGLDPELELRAAARAYRELVRSWEQAHRAGVPPAS